MPNAFSKLLKRVFPKSAWSLGGRSAELELPNRLSFKDGLKVHWLTVHSDGTLAGGVFIDINTMNATDPSSSDEAREVRVARACRVQNFLVSKGFPCEIIEEGRSLQGICNGRDDF